MDSRNLTAFLNLKPTKINQYGLPFKVKPIKVFVGNHIVTEPNERSSSVLVRPVNRDLNSLNVSKDFDTNARNSILLSPLINDR
jgi:hypothetical protein